MDPNRRLPSDKLEPPDPVKKAAIEPQVDPDTHANPNNEERRHYIEHQVDRGSQGITGSPEREAGHELER